MSVAYSHLSELADSRMEQRKASHATRSSNVIDALSIATLATVVALLGVLYSRWDFDDGRIVYRIVENLISGLGWAYNPGERLNASTSVLNTILVVGGALTGLSASTSAHVVGCLGMLLAAISIYRVLAQHLPPFGATVAAGISVFVLASSSTWGLETMLFAGLLCFCIHERIFGRDPWIAIGLLVLARPDGVVAAGLFFADYLIRERRLPLRGMVLAASVVLPWTIFSYFYFGQIFPDTLGAKVWQGRSGLWGHGRIYFRSLREHLTGVIQIATLLLAVIGTMSLPRRFAVLNVLTIFAGAQQAAYVLLNVPGYHWYFVMFDLWRWLFASLAILSFAQYTGLFRHPRMEKVYSAIALIGLLGAAAYQFRGGLPIDVRNAAYAKLGNEIDRLAPEADSIAALEVGTLGHTTKKRIVDLVGLTSTNPQFLTGEHSDRFFADPPELVALHNPPWHHERAISDDIRFTLMYRRIGAVEDPAFPTHIFAIDPAAAGTDAASYVRSHYTPIARSTARATASPAALCIIDNLNGRPTLPGAELTLKPLVLVVRGWAAVKEWESLSATVIVRLQNETGSYEFAAQRTARPDVATVLERPSFELAGFSGEAGITDVPPGKYDVMLGQRADGVAGSARGGDAPNLQEKWCGPIARIDLSPQ